MSRWTNLHKAVLIWVSVMLKDAHICHISPQDRTCLFHNKSMKQPNCMCGHGNKSLLWCGVTIWAKWAMKASMQRQNSTARSTFSFKLVAFILSVWKTNYPQFTCCGLTRSANNQLHVWKHVSVSESERARHSPPHVSRSHSFPKFVWAGHTSAADPSPAEPSRSCWRL